MTILHPRLADNLKLPLCPKCGDTKHVDTLKLEDVKRFFRFRRITAVPQPIVLEGTQFKCNKCDIRWGFQSPCMHSTAADERSYIEIAR